MKKFFKKLIWRWQLKRLAKKIRKLIHEECKKISENRGTGNHFDKYGM